MLWVIGFDVITFNKHDLGRMKIWILEINIRICLVRLEKKLVFVKGKKQRPYYFCVKENKSVTK